ncbi:methyl-CpG-binding domain-containing protein 2-like [Solanum dulcamara]|uniref:methyl-CpG-binding domain-containing protein 2-like n=1 Tax=Solanum dulcamara TaxID=45834 RepID=UPI002484E455|nr:methyl-CpG-binding domain-containing protein 2-like [Solanum dulcamara]
MEKNHQDVFTLGEMDQNVTHGSELADLNNLNREPNALTVSTSPDIIETLAQKPTEVTYTPGKQENQLGANMENQGANAHNQLMLYDPAVAIAASPVAAEVKPLRARKMPLPNYASRAFPDGGAFAVQCDKCFKWRYIHTKEKYEEIREHILEHPFYCETTLEYKSCEKPPDLTQDGSKLWAIDNFNIPRPPPRWERLLRLRKEGGTKFADVYYDSPSGMKLRSKIEVEKYLEQHPEYVAQGAKLDMFSFKTPKPLQKEYVKKRIPTPSDDINRVYDVNPISWARPNGSTSLHSGPVPFTPTVAAPLHVPDGNSEET